MRSMTGVVVAVLGLFAATVAHAATTAAGKPLAREARKACSEQVKAKGLKGKEASAARAACFAEQRPDLAARSACRKEAKAKGLAKPEAAAFVKSCAAKS
ncbi:hypothetical protein NK718_10830 [Alsobacter sp. SYSU M60028]|uniref:PsiF repeat-containing protein n=1 Tax=Alsobacter ponti TaxID=2962936 RepID=A0ABT1LD43_9HYPH|nr:hypothetical protein [Alsobacter ponti]MCP8939011.1 hypothetical protein [Alsobacter ponti]